MLDKLTNTEILIAVLGWKGGTVNQVAQELMVTSDTILNADAHAMRSLIRIAQGMRGVK